MSVCLSLKIFVTAGFYSSGNIPTGPVVVIGYFFVWGGGDIINNPKNLRDILLAELIRASSNLLPITPNTCFCSFTIYIY